MSDTFLIYRTKDLNISQFPEQSVRHPLYEGQNVKQSLLDFYKETFHLSGRLEDVLFT